MRVVNSDYASPTREEDEVPDYQDDDYDYNGEEDSGTSETQPAKIEEDAFSAPLYFEQEEIAMKAKPGDTVILNCDARNFASTLPTYKYYLYILYN